MNQIPAYRQAGKCQSSNGKSDKKHWNIGLRKKYSQCQLIIPSFREFLYSGRVLIKL